TGVADESLVHPQADRRRSAGHRRPARRLPPRRGLRARLARPLGRSVGDAGPLPRYSMVRRAQAAVGAARRGRVCAGGPDGDVRRRRDRPTPAARIRRDARAPSGRAAPGAPVRPRRPDRADSQLEFAVPGGGTVLRPGFVVAALFAASAALAQTYPSKPIRIIIAQAPGSATDVISRVVGNRLQEALGQPIVVEARPGAGGAVGTEAAARSAPDGYTLFMANNSTHGSNPALYSKLPYDAVNDFAPITLVSTVPYVLVVDPALPVKSVQDLVALAKSKPGKMNYASAGNGSTHQFCGELLKSMSGIDVLHVPYKGSPPAIAGLLGGEVSLMFANLTDIGSQIRSGKVKALAVTVTKRASLLPEVPTMSEAGLPGFEIGSWFGLLAPAGTPAPIVSRLNAETVKVLGRSDVQATLGAQGLELVPSSPEQFAAH